MTRLVIVADDLTGAADTAVPMAAHATVSLLLDHEGPWPADDVLAVDTDSRHCAPTVAATRAGAAARRARELGATVYKKVDSTLRGNIAAELRAMADVLGDRGPRPLVVLAPAFPHTGRTTVGGVVHVAGVPLAAPGRGGDVVALLRDGGMDAGRVPAPGDAALLAELLDRAHARGADAVVVDVLSESDLRVVVGAAGLATGPVLLAGSGGLARPLADALLPPAHAEPAPPPRPRAAAPARPELVVVGSYAEESRAQCRRLAENGVRHFFLTGGSDGTVVAALRDALLAGPVLLSPDPRAPVMRREAVAVARRLADTAVAALDRAGTLVATGGETARAVLAAAGVDRLAVLDEVAPGVVRSHVSSLDVDVVTKAGAFGDPDALLRCLSHRPQPTTRSS